MFVDPALFSCAEVVGVAVFGYGEGVDAVFIPSALHVPVWVSLAA